MAIAHLIAAPVEEDANADAILELAFIVSASDGSLAPEELTAFSELASALRGRKMTKEETDALLGGFLLNAQAVRGEDRLRDIASALPGDLRETAFKVVIGLTLVDHEENENEDELVGILAASLGLAERSIPLTAEAREQFDR